MRYRQANNANRHKFIRDDHGQSLPPGVAPIKDLKELRFWLQEAIDVEHFTIPPYLCALYSLKGGATGPNAEVYRVIRSVVMEEMLHMILAANILNAVGETPRIIPKKTQYLARYPRPLPHSAIGFDVGLLKFSQEAVNTFLRIERPAEPTQQPPKPGTFRSIGEMYAVVREGLNRLDRQARAAGQSKGIFSGKPELQVTDEHYYGGGGKLFPVGCIDSANQAIDEIVGQGEGIDGTIDDGDDSMFGEDAEVAHYFRFNEIFCGRRYQPGDTPNSGPTGDAFPVAWDAVYDMVPNPTMQKFANNPGVWEKMKQFNISYSKLLRTIKSACTGHPQRLFKAIPQMYVLRDQAIELMNEDSEECGRTAGPSFEYIPLTISHTR